MADLILGPVLPLLLPSKVTASPSPQNRQCRTGLQSGCGGSFLSHSPPLQAVLPARSLHLLQGRSCTVCREPLLSHGVLSIKTSPQTPHRHLFKGALSSETAIWDPSGEKSFLLMFFLCYCNAVLRAQRNKKVFMGSFALARFANYPKSSLNLF